MSTRGIWLAFAGGLLITGLLTGVKIALEHSRFGQQVEHMTLVLQQLRLGEAVHGERPVSLLSTSATWRSCRRIPRPIPTSSRLAGS